MQIRSRWRIANVDAELDFPTSAKAIETQLDTIQGGQELAAFCQRRAGHVRTFLSR